MGLRSLILTRNSYFLAAVAATAFVGDIAADYAVDFAWRWNNKGVDTIVYFVFLI